MTPDPDALTRLRELARSRTVMHLVEQAYLDLANGIALADILPELLVELATAGSS